ATSTGTGDVVGKVLRTGFTTGSPLSFGNPNNQISFQTGTPPAAVLVKLEKSVPTGPGFGYPGAVQRTYTITPTGGSGFVATLRSEERRVGKGCRSRWGRGHYEKRC